MTKLSVNINRIALLRNTRNVGMPDIIEMAEIALQSGAHGITVHPRPDQRHITYQDVFDLSPVLKKTEFNIEGNPFTGKYLEIVKQVIPDQATLVPDDPSASTSDHGWDLETDGERLSPVISDLKQLGIRVSLFMDPDIAGIEKAAEIGADRVELYTESYAVAYKTNTNLENVLQQYIDASQAAEKLSIGLNAGHDLNTNNLEKFARALPNLLEVSIGHALIADALKLGLNDTVKQYLNILSKI